MVPHFSNVLGQFLGWGRNPGLPHFGTLLVHPPLYNVMGAGRAANRSTREGSGKPCKYFPPRPEFFSYFRLFASQGLEILLQLLNFIYLIVMF